MRAFTAPLLASPVITGNMKLQTIPTVSLPAAGDANNGLVVLEDGGLGNGNLIIYVANKRYRIDGGTAF